MLKLILPVSAAPRATCSILLTVIEVVVMLTRYTIAIESVTRYNVSKAVSQPAPLLRRILAVDGDYSPVATDVWNINH